MALYPQDRKIASLDGSMGLRALLRGLTPDEFLAGWWEQRPLATHGDPSSLIRLLPDVPSDVGGFLDVYRGPVMVLGHPAIEETGGLADRFLVTPREARSWYNNGATLELDGLDTYLPELRAVVEGMRQELGLPGGTFSKTIVYASLRGSGLGAHFDAYANFILQLNGTKLWSVAPNANVSCPVDHYSLHEYPLIPPELRSYWRGEPPEGASSPAEWMQVALNPGSVLYLPRGWWHATEASSESLSLNFTLSIPTWLDLVIAEIRARLVVHEPWRHLVCGFVSPEATHTSEARRRLAELLVRLADDIGALEPDAVLARQDTPHDVIQIAAAVLRETLRL